MGEVERSRAIPLSQRGPLARLSPWSRTWLPRAVAAIGFGLLAKILIETPIVGLGGPGGADANSYWVAAQHAVAGQPLYAEHYGSFIGYSYPPLFAQALGALAWLPHGAFVWLWRALELLALRVALGSWTRAGIALLVFPPVIAEIETGNIHLFMAAACALAMRGHALPLAPIGLLKFATAPLVPLAWVQDRRGLFVGVAVAAGVVVASYLATPHYWTEYLAFLQGNRLPNVNATLLADVPLAVRLAAAGVLGIVALRFVRLAPFAVLLAYPVVWLTGLSTLVAVAAPVRARVAERGADGGVERMRGEVGPRTWQEVPS